MTKIMLRETRKCWQVHFSVQRLRRKIAVI